MATITFEPSVHERNPMPRRTRNPIRLYAFALREGDLHLAELLHRRLIREALTHRVLNALRVRLVKSLAIG